MPLVFFFFFYAHVPVIVVSLLLYTREMEPKLFYDSHNHHAWRLHRGIGSHRLLQDAPRCQIKVSGWRSAREQRGSVCTISTYEPASTSRLTSRKHFRGFRVSLKATVTGSGDYQSKCFQRHTINCNTGLNKWLDVINACGQCLLGGNIAFSVRMICRDCI